jgi:hypothetical protein
VCNTDGTGLTSLYEFSTLVNIESQISFSISESGGNIAFNDPVELGYLSYSADLDTRSSLNLITLPSIEVQMISPVIEYSQIKAIATAYPIYEDASYGNSSFFHIEQIKESVSRPGSLAFSPRGTQIAFSAALDGPTTDLYITDVRTSVVRRLSSGLTQAVDLEWSPHGDYIIHTGAKEISSERGGEPNMPVDGIWSASPDGTEMILLKKGQTETAGWMSPYLLLIYKWGMGCDSYDLSAVDIRSGSSTILFQGVFQQAVVDPKSGTVLVGHDYLEQTIAALVDERCPVFHPAGLYQISGIFGKPERIGDWEWEKQYKPIKWLEEWESFLILKDGEIQYLSPTGDVYVPVLQSPVALLISPSGQIIAEPRRGSVRLFSEYSEDIHIQGSFCNISWGSADDTLLLSDDKQLYVAQSPDYQLSRIPMSFSGLCSSEFHIVNP